MKRSPSAERLGGGLLHRPRYEPGEVRVRLTQMRDFLHVLQSRYMDTFFRLFVFVCCVQLLPTLLKVSHASGASLSGLTGALAELRVLDAVSMFYTELGWAGPSVLGVILTLLLRRRRTTYLLDYSLFEPPADWRISKDEIVQMMQHAGEMEGSFTADDVAFMQKILANSGTGEATAWPPGIRRCKAAGVAQDQSMQAAREEAETVICQCLASLFEKTGVNPKEVDFLVINCSLFSPTPSLCAMASNRFKMRSDMRTYNLSGQGCSASLLSVDLASELLQNNPNSIAVVVSTELITRSLYHGHQKSMLLQNTLFRCGGAALLLTNKARLATRAKYKLKQLVRTQCCDDDSYNAVYECQDESGRPGVKLSKAIVKVAGDAMKRNLTQLGPLVLPLSEQLRVGYSLLLKFFKRGQSRYVPSFKTAFDFFCIHAGGRAVLDGIEKNLRLLPEDLLPSRSVLHDRGNTSSSSIWYELDYIEQHMSLRRGHQILQLAFGSGFKCNSAVWTRLRSNA